MASYRTDGWRTTAGGYGSFATLTTLGAVVVSHGRGSGRPLAPACESRLVQLSAAGC